MKNTTVQRRPNCSQETSEPLASAVTTWGLEMLALGKWGAQVEWRLGVGSSVAVKRGWEDWMRGVSKTPSGGGPMGEVSGG